MATKTKPGSAGQASGSNGGAPPRGAGPALDAMLTDAVMGTSGRWVPGVAGVKAAARLATRPRTVARRGAGLAAELAKIAVGLAQNGEGERLAGITLGVCILDNEQAGMAGALTDKNVAQLAVAESARKGYLDGRALAGVFAWLRPNDLIWNYWINNYLLGKEPPAFDVLFWNADATNMPAALHRDFIELSLENSLVEPGGVEVMGTPIDLSKVTVDSYVVAGIADHIAPWQNCYATTQLLGSEPRFVLSTSGHIAALVNPPGNEKASYQTGKSNPPVADDWLESASKQRGTWWEDWIGWLAERSGDEKQARKKLGGRSYKPLEKAPGKYVLAQAGD